MKEELNSCALIKRCRNGPWESADQIVLHIWDGLTSLNSTSNQKHEALLMG